MAFLTLLCFLLVPRFFGRFCFRLFLGFLGFPILPLSVLFLLSQLLLSFFLRFSFGLLALELQLLGKLLFLLSLMALSSLGFKPCPLLLLFKRSLLLLLLLQQLGFEQLTLVSFLSLLLLLPHQLLALLLDPQVLSGQEFFLFLKLPLTLLFLKGQALRFLRFVLFAGRFTLFLLAQKLVFFLLFLLLENAGSLLLEPLALFLFLLEPQRIDHLLLLEGLSFLLLLQLQLALFALFLLLTGQLFLLEAFGSRRCHFLLLFGGLLHHLAQSFLFFFLLFDDLQVSIFV